MKSVYLKLLFILGMVFGTISSLYASDASLSRRVDGMDIYMGISHANGNDNGAVQKLGMLQGLKGKKHHVTVAIFDSKTGQRITDAKIVAGVGEMALSSNRKNLKQEKYGDAVSYGRDFYITKEGPYWIDLKIKRNGMNEATVTRFEWEHF